MRVSLGVCGALGVALVVAVLATSGGSSHKTSTSLPRPTVKLETPSPLKAHPCTLSNYYMQCKGTQTSTLSPSTAVFHEFGVDFAYGGPWAGTAHAHGISFEASYLSDSSKDWTAAHLANLRAGHVSQVFVWEQAADASLDGWNAGYDAAYDATHELCSVDGYCQKGLHIDFASDYDTNGYGCAFCGYYEGAAAWDRRVGDTTGGYGGVATVWTLCDHGITTDNWQTIAWSAGQWVSPSCAPLRQISINDYLGGYSLDFDIAVAPNYGQWPPPVAKLICFGKRAKSGDATCKKVIKEVDNYKRAEASSSRAYTARKCVVLTQRETYFANKIKKQPKSKRLAYRKDALRATRKAYDKNDCAVFAARVAFFSDLIKKVQSQY